MAFDIPRHRVFPIDGIDVRLIHGPHPFEAANREAIAANWLREVAVQPSLYDGTVVLLTDLEWKDGLLAGRCHAISYAGFLLWRRQRPAGNGEHVFAHAMLASADGALVAIRMASHTANSGKVYFAAGSFEIEDFPDGRVDADLNMRREVGEETGIDLAPLRHDPIAHGWSSETSTVIFRRYWLPWTADETAERIRAFVRSEARPEIDGPVIIRAADERPAGLSSHMPALIDWHFAHPG